MAGAATTRRVRALPPPRRALLAQRPSCERDFAGERREPLFAGRRVRATREMSTPAFIDLTEDDDDPPPAQPPQPPAPLPLPLPPRAAPLQQPQPSQPRSSTNLGRTVLPASHSASMGRPAASRSIQPLPPGLLPKPKPVRPSQQVQTVQQVQPEQMEMTVQQVQPEQSDQQEQMGLMQQIFGQNQELIYIDHQETLVLELLRLQLR